MESHDLDEVSHCVNLIQVRWFSGRRGQEVGASAKCVSTDQGGSSQSDPFFSSRRIMIGFR